MRRACLGVAIAAYVLLLCGCGSHTGGGTPTPSGAGLVIPCTYNITITVRGATVAHQLRLSPPSATADHLPEVSISSPSSPNAPGAISIDTSQSASAQVTYRQGAISVTYTGQRDQNAMSWWYLPQGIGAPQEVRASSAEIVITLTEQARTATGTIRLTTDDDTVLEASRTYDGTFTGTRTT